MSDKYSIFRKGFESTLRNEDKTYSFEQNVNGDYIDERVKGHWDAYVTKFQNSTVPSPKKDKPVWNPEKGKKAPFKPSPNTASNGRNGSTEKAFVPNKRHPLPKRAAGQKPFNTLKEDFEIFCKESHPELSLDKIDGTVKYVSKETAMQWAAYERAYKQAYHHLINKAGQLAAEKAAEKTIADQGPWIIGKRLMSPGQRSQVSPEERKKEFMFSRRPYFHAEKDSAMMEAQNLANENNCQFMVFSLSMVLKPEVMNYSAPSSSSDNIGGTDGTEGKFLNGTVMKMAVATDFNGTAGSEPRINVIKPCETAVGGSGGSCNTIQTPDGDRCIASPGLMKIEEPVA